jgi:Fic family protein
MKDDQTNSYVLDAAYKPFPPFEEWISTVILDVVRWQRYITSLQGDSLSSKEALGRALQIAKRAAALDTGAIEGLYEVDRGFTYTVACEAAAWQAALAQKGENVRSLFEAQLHAYDYVLDLATKTEPISEAAIRALHEEVCRAQLTYRVNTAAGPQEQALPKGQYKSLPNHVRTRKGADHSYAPVDSTPPEMARLVRELRSEAFLSAQPVIQAAYAHYTFVAIHPFADGNGRVARALASAFTYRAISMPIVIFSDMKNIYFDSLEIADNGNHQVFLEFMLARSLDTIKIVTESLRSGRAPTVEQSVAEIGSLYITKGGYTHEHIDRSGEELVNALKNAIEKALQNIAVPTIKLTANIEFNDYQIANESYRRPMNHGVQLSILFSSQPPAQTHVSRNFFLWVPKDPAGDDDILLKSGNARDDFDARVEELVPTITSTLQLRLNMFGESVVREMLAELSVQARKLLGR